MLLPLKYNMALARLAYIFLIGIRTLANKGSITKVKRGGFWWVLDLKEGIDLTIYLCGAFEGYVFKACQKLIEPGNIVLDIGANMGAITLPLARAVGAQGKVVAVEPTANPFSRLSVNIKSNSEIAPRVKIIQAFLTADDRATLPVSLLSSWNLEADPAQAHPVYCAIPQKTEGAKALTLDQLVAQEGLSRVDLIKLDVDGSEDCVLAGGEKILAMFKPNIIMEVAPNVMKEFGFDGDAPVKRLKRIGYRFTDLKGHPLEDDHSKWINVLKPGYAIDVIAYHPARSNSLSK